MSLGSKPVYCLLALEDTVWASCENQVTVIQGDSLCMQVYWLFSMHTENILNGPLTLSLVLCDGCVYWCNGGSMSKWPNNEAGIFTSDSCEPTESSNYCISDIFFYTLGSIIHHKCKTKIIRPAQQSHLPAVQSCFLGQIRQKGLFQRDNELTGYVKAQCRLNKDDQFYKRRLKM